VDSIVIILFLPAVLFLLLPLLERISAHRAKASRKTAATLQKEPAPAPEPAQSSGPAQPQDPVVLIGSLSSASQLSVCLSDGFYHIPAVIAGEDYRRIEYVAIYQSRRFFGAAEGVRYYARVRTSTVLPRYKITEIPRQSNMPYVRFELDEWQTLPLPIVPKGKGITSARCTLSRLISSDNMHQLLKK